MTGEELQKRLMAKYHARGLVSVPWDRAVPEHKEAWSELAAELSFGRVTPSAYDRVVANSTEERKAWEMLRQFRMHAAPHVQHPADPHWDDQIRDGWIAALRWAKAFVVGTTIRFSDKEKERVLTGDWEKDKPEGQIDLLEITKGLVGRRR